MKRSREGDNRRMAIILSWTRVTGKGTRSSSLIHCHRDYVNLDAEKRWHGCESYSIGRRKPLPRIVAPVILDYVSLLTGYVSYLATADVRCARNPMPRLIEYRIDHQKRDNRDSFDPFDFDGNLNAHAIIRLTIFLVNLFNILRILIDRFNENFKRKRRFDQ